MYNEKENTIQNYFKFSSKKVMRFEELTIY